MSANKADDPNTECASMGCKHPRRSHAEFGRCEEKRAFYNEVLYGFVQPLIYRACLCPWMEPIEPARYRVKDGPQA